MNQQTSFQSAQNEGRILLAIGALTYKQISSARKAAKTFEIPKSTLNDRRASKRFQRDCEPNSKKLTKLEESVIVQYILELDSRWISP